MEDIQDKLPSYERQDDVYGKQTESVPAPQTNIGIDTGESVYNDIVEAVVSKTLDMSTINSFDSVSRDRNTMYDLIDTMCEDPLISAALESYAEDATETNDAGKVVWVESDDSDIAKYIDFLLSSMRIDKNIYRWVYSLCKYGDLYIRLYRKSEEDLAENDTKKEKKSLNEEFLVKAYNEEDKYIPYVEMLSNPARAFELTKFGKTYAYIITDVKSSLKPSNNMLATEFISTYKFNSSDDNITLYGPTSYVHASLEDGAERQSEEVKLYTNKDNEESKEDTPTTYAVKRGQPLLSNVFKIWRELSLLENSILLNRISKSAIVRIIQVETGDMPPDEVRAYLTRLKQSIEQKSAIQTGSSMTEYTNPGPIENSIYVPVHDNKGSIQIADMGGNDVDLGKLVDLDYFNSKLFGALRIPKAYLGFTDDSAGFNGGESLARISARYAKTIKRIQNTVCQMVTDLINLFLLDVGFNNYINKFKIRMQAPTTKEELDRQDAISNKIQSAQDIVNLLSDIVDEKSKLRIIKSLMSGITTNTDIITVLDDRLEELENNSESETEEEVSPELGSAPTPEFGEFRNEAPTEVETVEETPTESGEEQPSVVLPSAEELGIDLSAE